jgi:CRP-like cAMP-binding protein
MHKNETFINRFFLEFNALSAIDKDCYCSLKEKIKFETLDRLQYYSLENEVAKKISFVCEGVLRIFHLDNAGNEWNKHFFRENDFFAASPNQEIPSKTAIQTLTKVQLISISIDHFIELSNKHKQIELFTQKLLGSVIEKEKEKSLMLMSLTASRKYEYFTTTFPNLENQIQHYHIASYLGITPTQLSRIKKKKPHQQM